MKSPEQVARERASEIDVNDFPRHVCMAVFDLLADASKE